MSEQPDALIYRLFEGLDRLAPGSEVETRRMLASVPALPPRPRVVDVGSGTGASAWVLANALPDARIVALERHAPFLHRLRARAAATGAGAACVELWPVVADMALPPVAARSLDLVWSEGALYSMGFAAGIAAWAATLRPGGVLVATELAWRTDAPPAPARALFAEEYPDIAPVPAKLAIVEEAGLRVLDWFVLGRDAWTAYYDPLQARVTAFRAAHAADPAAQGLAEAIQREIDVFAAHGESYGYLAIIAQSAG